jgi:hypothetical protein
MSNRRVVSVFVHTLSGGVAGMFETTAAVVLLRISVITVMV